VIRIWERRYGAVTPTRTETNRRLYSETAVDRLMLLRRATEAGHSISHIARLDSAQLRQMVDAIENTTSKRDLPVVTADTDFVGECLDAVRRLDTQGLEEHLRAASIELGSQGLLHRLAAPLAQKLGELWQSGEITAAHEHFASAVLRVFLGNLSRPFSLPASAPTVVVATPSGQLHELGAVLVAAAASAHGWRVTYLGVSLPAAEIAGAAIKNRAKAVALSLVYPGDDPNLGNELEALRRFLPSQVKIIVGGRATRAYAGAIERSGAIRANSIEDIYQILDSVRDGQNGNGNGNGNGH
jgi:methanogenic corrinoid protein MtbC1